MNIVIVSKNFWPTTIGGAEYYMHQIHNRISKKHRATVLTWGKCSLIKSILFSIYAGLKARLLRPDVTHINGYWADFTSVFAPRSVVTVHDLDFLDAGGLLNYIRKVLCKFSLLSADRIIAVSNKTKSQVMEMGINEEKVNVIPNGVNTKKKPLIFSMGRFARNKGYEYLCEAVEDLDVNVVIAGALTGSDYYNELTQNKPDNVVLWTDISDFVKDILYKACDIYVQPSIGEEGFGIAILEAMSHSKPVVVTDVFREVGLVPENYIVPSKDAEAIKNKITEVLRGGEWIGKEMREIAEGYSWESVADRVDEVYHEVLNRYLLTAEAVSLRAQDTQ